MILLERTGDICAITLNRPQRHNALVPQLLDELLAALNSDDCRDAGAVVLAANGPSFSTGGDVQGFWDHREDLESYANHVVGRLNDVILRLAVIPVPVIAAIHGWVCGGSMGLVLGSDIVIAQPETRLQAFYATVGFAPDGGWTAMLPDVVGHAKARHWLLTDCQISAQDAQHTGIVSELAAAPRERALAMAADATRRKPGSIKAVKRLLTNQTALQSKLDSERRAFVEQILTREAHFGMQQFLENVK